MAVSSIAWMLLGNRRSVGPLAGRGGTTLTDTSPASGAVEAATSSEFSRTRGTTPIMKTASSSTTPTITLHVVRDSGIDHSWVDGAASVRKSTRGGGPRATPETTG